MFFRHLAIISSLCVLSVLTGVYCTSTPETSVKIVVYIPHHLPYKNAVIYSSLYKTVDVINEKDTGEKGTEKMKWFGKS